VRFLTISKDNTAATALIYGSKEDHTMVDDKTKRAPQDRKLVSSPRIYEVAYGPRGSTSPRPSWRMP